MNTQDLVNQSKELLAKRRFNLSSWVSNSPGIVGNDKVVELRGESSLAEGLWKTLGDLREPKSERLSIRQLEDTKRCLLRLATIVYDQVQCLIPFTVEVKVLRQLLWQQGTSWMTH
ncbi:hypothetical protein T02_5236 [Trichinella nativa]|uniref:Uncharacterized protein n=2 Tax=Trichinella TaxID=6333 RepID=A0A0V1KQT2_9BILA|nr:hypothetical protein T03_16482 [Trichinella britovi]KRZ49214.1 hypothetical protein T02_5236 [Trichinella nativa]